MSRVSEWYLFISKTFAQYDRGMAELRCQHCGLLYVPWFCPYCERVWPYNRAKHQWTRVEDGLPESSDDRDYWIGLELPDGKRKVYEAGSFWRGQFWTVIGDAFNMINVKVWRLRDEKPPPDW